MSRYIHTFVLTFVVATVFDAVYWLFCDKKTHPLKSDADEDYNRDSAAKIDMDSDSDLETRKPAEHWETAMFFPSATKLLVVRGQLPLSAYPASSISQFTFYFHNALTSIHICALLVSEFEVANVLQERRNRGVKVQIITDFDTMMGHDAGCLNTGCRHLSKIGIPVRTHNTGHLMHNKFVIFDNEAVLTGSLNFTKMAIRQGTFENMVVTRNRNIVGKYIQEFDSLWKSSLEWNSKTKGITKL